MNHTSKLILSGIVSSSLFFQTVSAQKVLSVEEVVAVALKSNYDILLAKNDSATAAVDENLSYAAFLPSLNATATKLWNNNDQKQQLADGSKKEKNGIQSNNLNAAVNLNWTLFDGLRMFATRDKLTELLHLGELHIKNQVVNTVADVIGNYYNIVRQKQQLKAVQEQMSIDEERVKLADKKLSVGLGSKPELLQAKVDLNAQKALQLQQQTLIAQLKDQLNQLAGRKLPGDYQVTDSIPINLDLNLGDIQQGIDKTNPSLLVARKNIAIAQLSVREYKADRWPQLSFTSAYNFSRTDNKAVVNPYQPLFSRNKGFNYGFTATIPLFNNFLVRRNIEVAKSNVTYQQLSFESLRSQVDVSLHNAFKDYEYEKKALQLEEDNIALAKENVMIALERFRQGVSTYLELRDAQQSLEDAYNRLIAARYNTKLAETELLRIKGSLVQ